MKRKNKFKGIDECYLKIPAEVLEAEGKVIIMIPDISQAKKILVEVKNA